jgi:hypothetical protein
MSHSLPCFICEVFKAKKWKHLQYALHIILKCLFNALCNKNNRFVYLKLIGILNKQVTFIFSKPSFFNLLKHKIYECLKALKLNIITVIRWYEIMSKLEQMLLSKLTMTSVPSCHLLTAALTKGHNNIQVDNYTYIVHAYQAEKNRMVLWADMSLIGKSVFSILQKCLLLCFKTRRVKILQISKYNWPYHKALQAVHVTGLVYNFFSFTSYLSSFL